MMSEMYSVSNDNPEFSERTWQILESKATTLVSKVTWPLIQKFKEQTSKPLWREHINDLTSHGLVPVVKLAHTGKQNK